MGYRSILGRLLQIPAQFMILFYLYNSQHHPISSPTFSIIFFSAIIISGIAVYIREINFNPNHVARVYTRVKGLLTESVRMVGR